MSWLRASPLLTLTLGLIILSVCLVASLAYGYQKTGLSTAWGAFFAFDGSPGQVIIRTVRLPRALIAALVGGGLAVAGAIMQALTRNPLAAPGLFGINYGAALAVVIATFVVEAASLATYAWFGFLGAALAAAMVYLLGSAGRGGLSPMKLTVAGAAMTALLAALVQGVLVISERRLDEIRFWLAGSVAGRDLDLVVQGMPYMVLGLLAALALAREINTFSLGEDVARGLGQRTGFMKVAAGAVVVLLAGSAVAVAGPIGFVGLAVPHLTRALVGTDYRRILPHTAIHGGVLLLLADIVARFVVQPEEVPVGVMTALLGAPFFVYLARKGVRRA